MIPARAVAVAAAGLMTLSLLTGCARSTEGTVAMTTEPGAPLSTTRATPSLPTPSRTRPTTPRTPRSSGPAVPAPPDSLTMTCADYNRLDAATQKAVIDAILADERSILSPGNVEIAKSLADAVCQFLTDSTVSEVLLGG